MADDRNQDIVKRRLAGESLSAIGKSYGVSRERVRQIFAENATDEEWKSAQPTPKPRRKTRSESNPNLPAGEMRQKISIVLPSRPVATQEQIRAGIRAWLDNPRAKQPAGQEGRWHYRYNLIVTDGMKSEIKAKCIATGTSANAVIRGIIGSIEAKKERQTNGVE